MGRWETRYVGSRGEEYAATIHTRLADLPSGTWQEQRRYVPSWDDVGDLVFIEGTIEHRREHDSTGGFRGILGGWNRSCICGASWVVESASEPFKCPKDSGTTESQPQVVEPVDGEL